ncbi:MAG: type II toxin-antitoxin system RelE/ParE family toxin [Candidatus Omnitrophica bacterium]|nr:type II toxin-antitoxin system RelE/ParE family toxin [Candidatus Omnitrophota bacterium]
MRYEVKFPSNSIAKKFEKALNGISPKELRDKVGKETLSLADNPRPYGKPKIKPPLEVYSYVAQYRLRIGDYRVLYDVDDKRRIVWILALRKRNERTY